MTLVLVLLPGILGSGSGSGQQKPFRRPLTARFSTAPPNPLPQRIPPDPPKTASLLHAELLARFEVGGLASTRRRRPTSDRAGPKGPRVAPWPMVAKDSAQNGQTCKERRRKIRDWSLAAKLGLSSVFNGCRSKPGYLS